MMTVTASYVHHNYYTECEECAAINHQISLELYAANMFETVASYFNSEEGALKQFASESFLHQSSKGRENVQSLVELQNERGGRLPVHRINSPDSSCWENGLRAKECHLKMSVNPSLLDLHQRAAEKRDANLCGFLERHYLFQQTKFIQGLREHIPNLRQMGANESSLAEDLCAKLTLGDSDKKN